jgi:hypothetical protein
MKQSTSSCRLLTHSADAEPVALQHSFTLGSALDRASPSRRPPSLADDVGIGSVVVLSLAAPSAAAAHTHAVTDSTRTAKLSQTRKPRAPPWHSPKPCRVERLSPILFRPAVASGIARSEPQRECRVGVVAQLADRSRAVDGADGHVLGLMRARHRHMPLCSAKTHAHA